MRAQTRVTVSARLAHPPTDIASIPVLHDPHLDAHGRLTATVEPDQVNAAMAALVPHDMSQLTVSPASLEDLFLRHYDDERAS